LATETSAKEGAGHADGVRKVDDPHLEIGETVPFPRRETIHPHVQDDVVHATLVIDPILGSERAVRV
jgi:hypothetical protein